MQIVEISEPGQSNIEDEIVVGVDFGTTNSLIAYSKNQNPRLITGLGNKGLLPSVIFYDDQTDNFLIGKNKGQKGAISSIKRLLAKSYQDIQTIPALQKILGNFSLIDSSGINGSRVPKIKFKDKEYGFSELASKIFSHLKEYAELDLGVPITKAVVSIPAYFDDAARGAVLLAAKIAGFEVLRLIAEPTAAAYAYGFHKKTEGTYMVYDLGGGTFDVSILNMQTGIFQVIGTGGNNLLGGDDFDNILAEYIAKKFELALNAELYLKAKEIKEILSFEKEVIVDLQNKKIKINREDFEGLILPLVNETIKIANNTLFDTEVQLNGIILVGGATRLPLISRKLQESFEVEIFSDINPDIAVVIGAALQAENLSANSDNNSLLIDVLSLSVGLELYGGIAEKIIMRNTPIPFSITKDFTTQVDNQTAISFHIVQGEREMAKDCRSLARFELRNIPPMKAGRAKVEVRFAVDGDGILSVTATEVISGLVQNIDIKPAYGLTIDEINNLLENAFISASQDHQTKLLVETRIDSENLITGIKKALEETPDILDKFQKEEIFQAITFLQEIMQLENRENILLTMQKLNNLANNFIQKHLDKGAKMLLQGKHIDEL